MALKLIVEKLDEVPETSRSLYVEKDGKFVLDVEGGMEDVAGLKSALAAERQARKDAERAAKAKEADEASAKAQAEKAEMERKGEWEKLRQTVEAEKASLAKERDTALEGLKAQLIKSHVNAAIAEHKGSKHLAKLVEDQFEAVLSPEGDHKVIVKGDPAKTPAQFIEGLKKDASYGAFFEGSDTSGGGLHQSRGGGTGKVMSRAEFDKQDPAGRMKFVQDGGTVTD